MVENFEKHLIPEQDLGVVQGSREQEFSAEDQEAMSKVVDIYSEKDLKYRDAYTPFMLASVLNDGLISAYNRHFFVRDMPLAEGIKKTKQKIQEDKNYRESIAGGTYNKRPPGEEYRVRKDFSRSANVFYPEGILKIAKYFILNSNEQTSELSVSPKNTVKMLKTFLGELSKNGVLDQEVVYGLYKILEQGFGKISDRLADRLPRELIYRFSQKSPQEIQEIMEKAKNVFIENFGDIRKKWLEVFFSQAMSDLGTDGRDHASLTWYRPHFGCVFDSQTDVRSSFDDDYPTQASVLGINNKRHIIGIFINDGKNVVNFDEYGKEFPDAKGIKTYSEEFKRKEMTEEDFLKSIHFEVLPENYVQFFWDNFKLLTRKAINKIVSSKPVLEELITNVTSLQEEAENLHNKGLNFTFGRERYRGAVKSYYENLHKKARELQNKAEKRKENLTQEEREAICEVVPEYLKENTCFQNGQSAWDMIVALGKQYHLPVYNLKGDLLWPKQMKHEDVEKDVGEHKK